jgi:glycosyltransferase involved in cell wall biosynthesis
MKVDVILCTYNPQWNYLLRTLDSIAAQERVEGAKVAKWLVDNNSPADCAEKLKALCTERGFNYLFEKEQGLVHSRICGLRNTSGEVVVWVDDDTVLATGYLHEAVRIAEEKPFLGVWGGSIMLELEKRVPDYIRPHLALLTENHVETEQWSNYPNCKPVAGAGMCVRRVVGERYVANYEASPLRKFLGRSAQNLFSGEDWDFCLTAPELGLGVGRIPSLSLTHLIPERRTTEEYILKIAEGHRLSAQIVCAIRGMPLVRENFRRKIVGLRWRGLVNPSFEKKLLAAELAGLAKGLEFVRSFDGRQLVDVSSVG